MEEKLFDTALAFFLALQARDKEFLRVLMTEEISISSDVIDSRFSDIKVVAAKDVLLFQSGQRVRLDIPSKRDNNGVLLVLEGKRVGYEFSFS